MDRAGLSPLNLKSRASFLTRETSRPALDSVATLSGRSTRRTAWTLRHLETMDLLVFYFSGRRRSHL